MKNWLTLILILCISSFISAQEKVIREDWYNGSLKKHLILRGGDTLYFEYGYENGQTAIKRWGQDSLYLYGYGGNIFEKYFRNVRFGAWRYSADSIISFDSKGRRETIWVKIDSVTSKEHSYDADECVYITKRFRSYYENRLPDNTLWSKGTFELPSFDRQDTLLYSNGKIQAIIHTNELNSKAASSLYRLFDDKGDILYESKGRNIIIPEKDNLECLYGFKNQQGEWFIKPQYDNVKLLGLQHYIASTMDKALLMNLTGEKIGGTEYEFLEELNPQESCHPAYKQWQTNYRLLFPDMYYRRVQSRLDFGNAMLLKCRKNGRYGVIDMVGNVLLPPQYQNVRKHESGRFEVQIGKKWGIVDSKGNVLVQPVYTEVSFTKNLNVFISTDTFQATPYTRHQCGLVNDQSQVLLPTDFRDIRSYENGNFYVHDNNGNDFLFNPEKGRLIDSSYRLSYFGDAAYLKVYNPKNRRVGIISIDGDIILPIEYTDIRLLNFSDDNLLDILIIKNEKGKWGFYSLIKKDWLYKPNLDEVCFLPYFLGNRRIGYEGLGNAQEYNRPHYFGVKKEGKWQIWDRTLKLYSAIGTDFDYLGFEVNKASNEGEVFLFLVKNKKVQFLSASSFPLTTDFRDNYDFKKHKKFLLKTFDGIELLFNTNGDLLFPPQYKLKNFVKEYAILEDTLTHKQKLLSPDGSIKDFLNQYKILKADIENNVIVVEDPQTKLVGVVDRDGQEVIPIKNFAVIAPNDNNVIWVRSDFPNIRRDSVIFYHNMGLNALDSNWHFYDFRGQRISTQPFQKPFKFFNSIGVGLVNNKMGLWNDKGKEVLPPQYKFILRDTIDNTYYLARQWADSSWTYGFADSTGRVIRNTDFSMLSNFYGNYALVIENNQKGIIDKKGNWLCPPDENALVNYRGCIMDTLISPFYKNNTYYTRYGSDSSRSRFIFRNDYDRGMTIDINSYSHVFKGFNSLTREKQNIFLNACLDVLFPSYTLPNVDFYQERLDDSLILSPLFLNRIFYGTPMMYLMGHRKNNFDKFYLYTSPHISHIALSDFKIEQNFINIISFSWSKGFQSYSFYLKSGIWKPIKLHEILSLSDANISGINSLLMNKIKELKGENLDCNSGASFFEMGSKLCFITSKGLQFHYKRVSEKDAQDKYLGENKSQWNSAAILLTWDELQPFLKLRP